MRVALIQTKQNELYSFHKKDYTVTYERALALQAEMLGQCFRLVRKAFSQKCDIIVTTEAINFCGLEGALGGHFRDLVPLYPKAPLFSELSELAREAGGWLVAGAYNKRYDGKGGLQCYNSAFIYDRKGELRGIYDKIHLAGIENDSLTPGQEVLTVDTDIGRMGVAICYDLQFEDVCKKCKNLGAEFMVVPSWGWEHGYGMERIQETGLKMAVAMGVPYWMPIEGARRPSELIDGKGRVLAVAGCESAELLIGEFADERE